MADEEDRLDDNEEINSEESENVDNDFSDDIEEPTNTVGSTLDEDNNDIDSNDNDDLDKNTNKTAANIGKVLSSNLWQLFGKLPPHWQIGIVLGLILIFLLFIIIISLMTGDIGTQLKHIDYPNCDSISIRIYKDSDDEKGKVKSIDFETYIAGVVTNELNGGGIEARKAQAIAARTYAIHLSNGCVEVLDNRSGMIQYDENPSESGREAAKATESIIMIDSNEEVFEANWSNFPRTDGYADFPYAPKQCEAFDCSSGTCSPKIYKMPSYEETASISIPVDYYGDLEKKYGHCYGMSQIVAMYFEEQERNVNYILQYFYDFEEYGSLKEGITFGEDGVVASGSGIVPWGNVEYYDCKNVRTNVRGGTEESQYNNITLPYNATPHKAWDVNAGEGSEIYSIGPGEVVAIRRNETGFGLHVIVQHENAIVPGGYVWIIYAHLSWINTDLSVGYGLKAYDLIGKEGRTGNSSGSHLHFETNKEYPCLDKKWGSCIINETRIRPHSYMQNGVNIGAGYTFEDVKKLYCKRRVSNTNKPNPDNQEDNNGI